MRRRARPIKHPVRFADVLDAPRRWQSVFGRLAGYEDVNDAGRVSHDSLMRDRWWARI